MTGLKVILVHTCQIKPIHGILLGSREKVRTSPTLGCFPASHCEWCTKTVTPPISMKPNPWVVKEAQWPCKLRVASCYMIPFSNH